MALFTFKGSKASIKTKAAAGNFASPFAKFFEGSAVDISFSNVSDVNEATVLAALAGATQVKTQYEFGTGDASTLEEDEEAAAIAAQKEKERLEKEAADAAAVIAAGACVVWRRQEGSDDGARA